MRTPAPAAGPVSTRPSAASTSDPLSPRTAVFSYTSCTARSCSTRAGIERHDEPVSALGDVIAAQVAAVGRPTCRWSGAVRHRRSRRDRRPAVDILCRAPGRRHRAVPLLRLVERERARRGPHRRTRRRGEGTPSRRRRRVPPSHDRDAAGARRCGVPGARAARRADRGAGPGTSPPSSCSPSTGPPTPHAPEVRRLLAAGLARVRRPRHARARRAPVVGASAAPARRRPVPGPPLGPLRLRRDRRRRRVDRRA